MHHNAQQATCGLPSTPSCALARCRTCCVPPCGHHDVRSPDVQRDPQSLDTTKWHATGTMCVVPTKLAGGGGFGTDGGKGGWEGAPPVAWAALKSGVLGACLPVVRSEGEELGRSEVDRGPQQQQSSQAPTSTRTVPQDACPGSSHTYREASTLRLEPHVPAQPSCSTQLHLSGQVPQISPTTTTTALHATCTQPSSVSVSG